MGEKIITFCDRCKKKMKQRFIWRPLQEYTINERIIEICQDCEREFKKFMKGKR